MVAHPLSPFPREKKRLRNVARIAVVDFDVHHGNGTQDVLCRTEHPGFLYASIHAFNRGGEDGSQARIFPGTGAHGEAHGNVVNIPLADQVTLRPIESCALGQLCNVQLLKGGARRDCTVQLGSDMLRSVSGCNAEGLSEPETFWL